MGIWPKMKPYMGLDFPNLPYLFDGDFRLTESKSIMKYFCRKHNPSMLGCNPKEVATADMVSRVHDTMHHTIGKHCFEDGNRESLLADIESYSKLLSDFLGEKTFMVGD